MPYWYFDTNAISMLNNLREELGNDVIQKFLNGNKILVTERNNEELRQGTKESLRFIDLAKEFQIWELNTDRIIKEEIYRINHQTPPQPKLNLIEANQIELLTTFNENGKDNKNTLHTNYLWKFEEDRKVITNEILVVFGIFLGIRKATQELGFKLDISKINYTNYPSTYVSNFVNYFWLMRNPTKAITPNDLYDLVNSAAAPLVERFYSEGALIQALISVKNHTPSKLSRALDRGRQKFPREHIPNTVALKNTEADIQTPMLQKTELYRVNDLKNHIYASSKEH